MYLEAVRYAFGSEIDYAQSVKLYGQDLEAEKRYGPAKCIGAEKHVVQDNPDTARISTSYVDQQNLTMRMCMRRTTRLTNGLSKELETHMLALDLYFLHYNFARPHKSSANPYPTTPAMAAMVSDHIWTIEETANLIPK